ncbi:MAG: OmpA family protein [Bacteroidales bacterium]|nr:OmpA family protein [Bacteroidales bacterium]
MISALCARAQSDTNWVFNSSFEAHGHCPERIDAAGIMSGVDAWWQPTLGSSDHFDPCGGRECSVPRNKMGVQTAHSGNAYCGIYCSQENYREYLQTELVQPLVAGHRYRVGFWVSLAEKSPHAVATLGLLLTCNRVSDSTWGLLMQKEEAPLFDDKHQVFSTPYIPQIEHSAHQPVTDTKQWVYIGGEIVADGGERFLTIGNFRPFNQSHVVSTDAPDGVLPGAYYYVDDVEVVPLDVEMVGPAEVSMLSEGDIVPLWGVLFATGKSDVLPQSFNELHRLKELLDAYPNMTIELRGHTDDQGTVNFNLQLSRDRAAAVADYLVKQGISRERVKAVGMGKSMPIDSNLTPEGRSRNRRVEYRVISVR